MSLPVASLEFHVQSLLCSRFNGSRLQSQFLWNFSSSSSLYRHFYDPIRLNINFSPLRSSDKFQNVIKSVNPCLVSIYVDWTILCLTSLFFNFNRKLFFLIFLHSYSHDLWVMKILIKSSSLIYGSPGCWKEESEKNARLKS